MAKSKFALAVDEIQAGLRPMLSERGFKVRGRTFNRKTEDGLTQVVNIQMGPADPPGTLPIPWLRPNLHGLFTVNLGVYVPEVSKLESGTETEAWVQEYHCPIRARLGEACGVERDLWWKAKARRRILRDVQACLEEGGLPFLERFATRDRILAAYDRVMGRVTGAATPARIVCAIILAERGEAARARQRLEAQLREAEAKASLGHAEHVRGLARELGLGDLAGG